MPDSPTAPRNQLLRILGVGFSLAVVIGGTLGVGILRSPAIVAANTDGPGTALLLWLVGGIYALLGGAAFAELGSRIPRSGGVYVYVHETLGDGPGFLIGWADIFATSAAIAFAAVAFVEFVGLLYPPLASHQTLAAAGLVVGFTLSQFGGVRFSSAVTQSMSALKALLFLGLIAGLLLFAPPAADPIPMQAGSRGSEIPFIAGLIVALQLVIGAYDGWSGGTYFAGEDREPQRNLPRAILGGVLLVMLIYLLTNIALFHVLPYEILAHSELPAADAARLWLGERGAQAITLISAISVLPLLGCVLMVGSRITWAMASDGLLPRQFARVDARGTPVPALLAVAATSLLMIAGAGGMLNTLIGISAVLAIVTYGGGFTALLTLRRTSGAPETGFRMPGHPHTTLLLLAIAVALALGVVISAPGDSTLAIVVLALAWPVFRLSRHPHGGPRRLATADDSTAT